MDSLPTELPRQPILCKTCRVYMASHLHPSLSSLPPGGCPLCDISEHVHCGLSLHHLPRAELTLWAAGLLGGSALPLSLLALLPLAQWGHFVRKELSQMDQRERKSVPKPGPPCGQETGMGTQGWAVGWLGSFSHTSLPQCSLLRGPCPSCSLVSKCAPCQGLGGAETDTGWPCSLRKVHLRTWG